MSGSDVTTDLRDLRFVLKEMIGLRKLKSIPRFAGLDPDDVDMILAEGDRLARERFVPCNSTSDHTGGATLVDGAVSAPAGFKEAFTAYAEGGWLGLSLNADSGGQELPNLVRVSVMEAFIASNPALHTYASLTTAAARVFESFGTETQKALFLHNLVQGRWTGTMCLTEPDAGSDVGDISTRATPRADGLYAIKGVKQFISGGDHDLTENIVHLVLARVEGSPTGVLGISLFAVPKIKINTDGSLGAPNDVTPTALEKKMGLKGSATTQLTFGEQDSCEGYLIGGEGEGLVQMFQMMYDARVGVGHQALAMSANAYEHALRYAKERVQGAHPERRGDPEAPRVPIIVHPDVRRMLMEMRAYTCALRRLIAWTAKLTDVSNHSDNSQERRRYSTLLELVIPVAKAYATDRGLDVTSQAMMVYGGYGYMQEYPVEQSLRDVKVTSVYEGTNGIQAIDLLFKKILVRRGRAWKLYVTVVEEHTERYGGNDRVRALFEAVNEAKLVLVEVTEALSGKRQSELNHLLLVATPYMELFGHFTSAHMLVWGAGVAAEKLEGLYKTHKVSTEQGRRSLAESHEDARFYHNTIETARFFVYNILPRIHGLKRVIKRGDSSPIDMIF